MLLPWSRASGRTFVFAVALVSLFAVASSAEAQPSSEPPYPARPARPPPPPPPPPPPASGAIPIPIASSAPTPFQPPAPPPQRRGLVAGVSLGVGIMGCNEEGCDGDAGISIGGHLGGFVAHRVAVLASVAVISASEEVYDNRVTTTRSVLGIGARFWPIPRLWLEAGLGRAKLSVHDQYSNDQSTGAVASLFGGIGYELKHTPKLSIDIHFRGGIESYEDVSFAANSFELSVSWF